MSNVVPFRRKPRTEFDCPKCGMVGTVANIGRIHWGACSHCAVRWLIGENLFSGWRDESAEVWRENERALAALSEVSA